MNAPQAAPTAEAEEFIQRLYLNALIHNPRLRHPHQDEAHLRAKLAEIDRKSPPRRVEIAP